MYTIRASKLGFPCVRNVWLSTRGLEEQFDKRTLRIFDVGNAIERLAVKWLQEDGWNVDWNEGSQEAEWEINIYGDGVVISGHPDAIIWRDGEDKILADVKSMNSRAYKHWTDEGTKDGKLQYYVQVNLYAHVAELSKCAIVGVNKDTSDYTVEIFPYDEQVVRRAIEKAEFIANSEKMPDPVGWAFPSIGVTSEVPEWCCRYCSYKKMGVCGGVKNE